MKCENCDEREATVHYTEIEGAEKKEIHLCEECYRQKAAPVQKVVDFAELLKGLLHGALKEHGAAAQAICPTCGISLAEFRASGRFGCPNDYQVFQEAIRPLLEKIQHSARHVGSVPSRAGTGLQRENELIRLRRALERAVQREEYEEAARLRDRIRTLAGKKDAPNGTL
jgi:protein arginine kinase activator